MTLDKRLIALLLTTAITPGQEPATEPARRPGELQLRTERVVIFKDGHALLAKLGRAVVGEDGTLFTDEVPDAAVLGSFWASCETTPIRTMTARWVEESRLERVAGPCADMRDLLRANEGRDVRLTLQWPEERQVDARIVEVLETEPEFADGESARGIMPPNPNPYAPYRSATTLPHWSVPPQGPTEGEQTAVATRAGGTFVVIEQSSGAGGDTRRAVLPVSDVRAISGSELETMCERAQRVTATTKRLTFQFDPGAAGQELELRILYFTPGLRWIPTYRLSGDLDDSGRLALQAEILNELEDIEGAAIDLVVGVPNFRFGDVISPLSLERTMQNVLAQAAPQIMGNSNVMSNALFAQRAGEWRPQDRAEGTGAAGGLDMAKELAFTGEQDLFVYSVERLSLPRGARASVPLWTNDVALSHLYTMDIDVVRDVSRNAARARNAAGTSPLELARNDVWHQLRLQNGSKAPWTTGAALVTKDLLPLGQELLTYTPAGGATLLPVTVAIDVRGDYSERELSREPTAIRWNGSQYARVVHRGTILVRNYKQHAVEVRVGLGVGGKVLSTDDEPNVVARDHRAADWEGGGGDLRLNGHADVTWRFRLEPGAEREVSVDFETFVR